MKLTSRSSAMPSVQTVSSFGGYNDTDNFSESQFSEMKDLSSDGYPRISPRTRRGILRSFAAPGGLCGTDKLAWVDGTSLYYNGSVVPGVTLTSGEKQLVRMGAWLLVFPDGVGYNTFDGTVKRAENDYSSTGAVTYSMCRDDGTVYTGITVQNTAPENPSNGDLWIDNSGDTHYLYQWSASQEEWISVSTTFIKIASSGIASGFSDYDVVTVSGSVLEQFNSDGVTLYSVYRDTAGSGAYDYLLVVGFIDQVTTQSTPITVSRSMPEMDFVIERNNRIWGCSSQKHEIYGSKLGDFTNWRSYLGISTDSYAATIGTEGDFTGIGVSGSYVLFFKEHTVHKLYGDQPSNFQVVPSPMDGVKAGSHLSICSVNNVLFYQSVNGIVQYTGGAPSIVSPTISGTWSDAVCGAFRGKLYVSMKNSSNTWSLFVYDPLKGLWHREDATHAIYMARAGDELYYIDATDSKLKNIGGDLTVYGVSGVVGSEAYPEWEVVSEKLGLQSPVHKFVKKLIFRVELEAGASISISLSYGGGAWEAISTISTEALRSVALPIQVKRCDYYRFKITGTGSGSVQSIGFVVRTGTEVR